MRTQLYRPEAMIFDLDGTLFKTETNLLPAYHRTFEQLRREGSFQGPTPPDSAILGSLGMLLEHIWERVLPGYPREVHQRANEVLLEQQLTGLREGVGELYPDVERALRELHAAGVRLFVASNGEEGYVKGVVESKMLAPLFEGVFSAGEYKTRSKNDLVRLLLDRYQVKQAWMVGDRSSDIAAGRANGLATIGCDYAGFRDSGELRGADARITGFTELLQLWRQAGS